MRQIRIIVPCALPTELNPNWQYQGPGFLGLKSRAITYLKSLTKAQAISAKNDWWWKKGGKNDIQWKPMEQAKICATIVLGPNAKTWDETNVRAALKPAEDALVQSEIIKDDNNRVVIWEPVRFQRGERAEIIFDIREV